MRPFRPGHRAAAGSTSRAEGNVGAAVRYGFTDRSWTGISINPAGTVEGTNAPYLQLLVCQKDQG